MTVKELKEKLAQFNDDMEVQFGQDVEDYWGTTLKALDVNYIDNGFYMDNSRKVKESLEEVEDQSTATEIVLLAPYA